MYKFNSTRGNSSFSVLQQQCTHKRKKNCKIPHCVSYTLDVPPPGQHFSKRSQCTVFSCRRNEYYTLKSYRLLLANMTDSSEGPYDKLCLTTVAAQYKFCEHVVTCVSRLWNWMWLHNVRAWKLWARLKALQTFQCRKQDIQNVKTASISWQAGFICHPIQRRCAIIAKG